MNAHSRIADKMTKAEFERFMLRHEGPKCEYVQGRVVQQSQTTKTHARIVTGFMACFLGRLDRDLWSVTADTIAVEYDDKIRLPDLLIERLDAEGPPLRALAPVVLVEVMSPSSAKADFYDKPREYLNLPSLLAYVVASQDERACWVWARSDTTAAFSDQPTEVRGNDGAVGIDGLDISLPLAEIYRATGVI